MKFNDKIANYSKFFSEIDLFEKLKLFASKIGIHLLYSVFILYVLLSDKKIPPKIRMTVIAALGYLIVPSDMIPDILPVLGFSDDAAFIAYAVSQASEYITPEILDKSFNRLAQLVGNEKAALVRKEDSGTKD